MSTNRPYRAWGAAAGAGVRHLLTPLLPLEKGASHGVARVERKGTVSAEASFTDGRRLVVEVDPDPAGGVRMRETLPDGAPGRDRSAGRPER